MSKKKTSYKINLALVAGFVIIIGVILYVVQSSTNAMISELCIKQARAANRALANYLTDLQNQSLERAEIIAGNEFIVKSMDIQDHEAIARNIKNLGEGIDFVTVCDANGIVIARYHSDVIGEDLSNRSAVASVLQTGKSEGAIENIPNLGLAVRAGAAIYDGKEIIGVIVCGFMLDKTQYLDSFKEQNNCEASIFCGDERINTTVKDAQGIRITGSRANEKVVEAVLDKQQIYTDYLNVSSGTYRAYYSPIIVDGQAIGMLFTGLNIEETLEQQRNLQYMIILIGLVAVAAAGVFFIIFNRFNRIYTSTLEELSDKTESLNIFENVLDAISIFIYVTDPETDKILFTNKALREHLGIEGSVNGEYCWKVFQVGMTERCSYCSLNKLLENPGETVSWQAQNTITGRYYRNIDRLVDWPDKGKVHFCQRIDITEMRDAQEAMLRMSSIVQSSPNFIAFKKITGECTFVNKAASVITGYSQEELLAGNYIDLMLDAESAEYLRNEIYPAVLEKGVQNYEVTATMKDGRVRTLSACSFVIEAEEKAFGTIANDITEKKQLASNMEAALKKAEQANRAKSDFLSRMSHEMRTPMNAIIGMTNLAEKAPDREESLRCLKIIDRSAEHLLDIINDILDMSRIESDKLELVETDYRLKDLLKQAIDIMEIRFAEKDQSCTVNIDGDVPETVVMDGQKLVRILINLLSNANKFTHHGGNISLRAHKVKDGSDGCKLLIEVEDDGVGIPEEQQRQVFVAFEQADNTITRQYGGTGLGLAVSKSMVNLMGGDIGIKSEQGKGSVFFFTVKVRVADSSGGDTREADVMEYVNDTDSLSGKNVLIADDLEVNREILAALLGDMNINVECAETGLEAFNKFTACPEKYDLIFMDIHMPEMDGYEATGKIRGLSGPKARTVPIIAVTADVFSQDIEKCIAAGMNDHIGKPLNICDIIAKMKRHLS